MKFERKPEADKHFSELLGREAKMEFWYAKAGDWQFIITYDAMHDHWGASWQTLFMAPGKRYTTHQCDTPPPGEKIKFYKSQHEAEQACFRKYRELRANN